MPNRRRMPLVLLAAMGMMATPAIAADTPNWLPILKLQIREANGCDVVEVVNSRDMKVGENTGTEGRARCGDGREYDFTLAEPAPEIHVSPVSASGMLTPARVRRRDQKMMSLRCPEIS